MLKNLKSGAVIVCPNNKRTGEEEEPKPRRRKKGEDTAEPTTVRCTYSRPAAAEVEPVAHGELATTKTP